MKRLLYYILILFSVYSCSRSESLGINDGEDQSGSSSEMVEVKFDAYVKEAVDISSRVINENQINNLALLVFDANSRFIGRYQASMIGLNYSAMLPQSVNKRIVHFIANYDWSTFSDANALNKDEGEVVAQLKTTTDLIMWNRTELASGINATVFASTPVALLRNMAKMSLVNLPTSNLTNAQFSIFNIPSMGTVAPFNSATRTFDNIITDPAGVSYSGSTAFSASDQYIYERKNSTVATNPTYVIVKGTYNLGVYYYKIDLIDGNKNMYDIQRNTYFNIIVESVNKAGYSTLAEAQSNPASNNITAWVLLQSYPTISDGTYVLTVDKTSAAFTTNGQIFRANAIYKTVAGVVMNSSVSVTVIQDPLNPVLISPITYDPVTGNISASVNNVPPDGIVYTATVNIVAGNLARTIKLMLHQPLNFTNVSITPSVVGNVVGSPVTLKFTVPSEASYLIPFNCYITTDYLTPDFGNMEVVNVNGSYVYKWKVTQVGEQTITLKTNTDKASEVVYIESDLFAQAKVSYSNTAGNLRFSEVLLVPNPVNFGVGNPVQLRFTVPLAGTYSIYTNNLTPVSGTVVGGIYTYNALTPGEQIVNFTTRVQNSSETIKLVRSGFSSYPITLKNQLINLSGTLKYSNTAAVINAGIVTVSVGSTVVGIFATSSTGTYSISIQANIGDVLTYSFTSGTRTYTATNSLTSASMVINKTLL